MNSHSFFLLGAYGLTAVCMAVEIALLHRRRVSARRLMQERLEDSE